MNTVATAVVVPEELTNLSSCLYVSTAAPWLSLERLDDLVAQARAINAANGITGILLYGGGNFMQYFEGPKSSVQVLRKRLESDPRHYDVHFLLHAGIPQQRFPSWTMGFVSSDPNRMRAGFAMLADDQNLMAQLFEASSVIERIMKRFYDNSR